MFLLKHKDGRYVGNLTTYTANVKDARIYYARQTAERDRSVSETVVELEKEKSN